MADVGVSWRKLLKSLAVSDFSRATVGGGRQPVAARATLRKVGQKALLLLARQALPGLDLGNRPQAAATKPAGLVNLADVDTGAFDLELGHKEQIETNQHGARTTLT